VKKDPNAINVDDKVVVLISSTQSVISKSATVINVPHATGEGWIFRDNNTHSIFYVSEGCTI